MIPARFTFYSTFQMLLCFLSISLAIACEKKQDDIIDDSVESLFNYELNGISQDANAEAFIYNDSIIVMTTDDLSFYFDGYSLQKRNLNQSNYSEVIVSGIYSTNVPMETTGFIQIENWDIRNILISGSFQFDAFDSFDTTKTVTVTNGTFEDISIFRTNTDYYKGKVRAKFKNQNIAYRLVNAQWDQTDNTLRIKFSHPSKNDFTLTLDANLDNGTYLLEDLDADQFLLEYEDRQVKQRLFPEVNCKVVIAGKDLDNEKINITISGEFSDEFAAPFPIEDLNIRVTTIN
ncbi:MAG: hypothetical protein KDC24_02825 [Saprospiraceae bacterium]|nr:hypothetical protein [Saprospiraceae bacterium]